MTEYSGEKSRDLVADEAAGSREAATAFGEKRSSKPAEKSQKYAKQAANAPLQQSSKVPNYIQLKNTGQRNAPRQRVIGQGATPTNQSLQTV